MKLLRCQISWHTKKEDWNVHLHFIAKYVVESFSNLYIYPNNIISLTTIFVAGMSLTGTIFCAVSNELCEHYVKPRDIISTE